MFVLVQPDSIWKKVFKRPSAVVTISIIGISCILALFAYILAPDDSPSANRMIIELTARQPGFKKQLLHIPGAEKKSQHNIINLFTGHTPAYSVIPINGYYFTGDSLAARHYIDEGIEDTLRYPLKGFLVNAPLLATIPEQQAYIASHNIKKRTFWLGTDRSGRDMLSRLLVGSRVSLAVGFIAVILSLTIGIILGSIAGYFSGWIDDLIMWIINILHAIPTLLLVFAITLTLGKGFWEIFIAIGLTMWVGTARLIRGQVMSIREMDYVAAARVLGAGDLRIIFRHILPNVLGPVMVIAAGNFAAAILIEAGLSFLGFGVQPPDPSWGLMIKENYNFLLTSKPLLALVPGLTIMLLVFAFNILGNALRDAIDVTT